MSKIEEVLESLQDLFSDSNVEDYYELFTEEEIWIEDSKRQDRIVSYTTLLENILPEKTFKIENPNQKEIVILAVDGKGIVGNTSTSCDGIFFDDIYFCFAEFKYNSYTTRPSSIDRNIEKGIDQLEKTIEIFKPIEVKEKGYQLEAYLGIPPHYPSFSTIITNEAIRFSNNYKVKLIKSSTKTF